MNKRRILLCVTGLSPQVVTETLFALATREREPWIPDEVQVITTRDGEQRVRLALLSKKPAWFHRLIEDYRLPDIRFGSEQIHVLRRSDGSAMDDVRTHEDNENASDQITELVRQYTADPDTELHASIAGGRKTLGYYLGYALSLFGRPRDRLSHVLVNEPFESSWNFFYPTPYSQVIETRDQSLADTRDARVTLAEIPFVSLREGLPRRLLQGRSSFTGTVDAARRSLEPPELLIDLDSHRLCAGGEIVGLRPAELAFYAMMARRASKGDSPINHRDQNLVQQYLLEYAELVGKHSGDYEQAERALSGEDPKEWFEQRKSKTNKALHDALGEHLAKAYRIQPSGRRPHTRFGLGLTPEAIEFVSGKLADAAGQNASGQDGACPGERRTS